MSIRLRSGTPKWLAFANSILAGALVGALIATLLAVSTQWFFIGVLLGVTVGYFLAREKFARFFAWQTKRVSIFLFVVMFVLFLASVPAFRN